MEYYKKYCNKLKFFIIFVLNFFMKKLNTENELGKMVLPLTIVICLGIHMK